MKQIAKWLIVIPIVVGIAVAIGIAFRNQMAVINEQNKIEKVFSKIATKPAEVSKFYTYGTSLNIEGRIKGVSKDNFEGIKLIVTDGEAFEKYYSVNYTFEETDLLFTTSETMNWAIDLEEIPVGTYYVQARIKVNNNKNFKYYTLSNSSNDQNIEYYTLTKNKSNRKIEIQFRTENWKGKTYRYLGLVVTNAKLPESVYDIVVDSGHGGTDVGETNNGNSESALMLEYGKALKTALEAKGYKVKLTRDDDNNDSFTSTNMYDEDGRINIACKTKAKYMISLHTGESGYSGIQVYVPNNIDFALASHIANSLYNGSSLEFSPNNAYKKQDGIYQKNYTTDEIKGRTANLEKQGIEPYSLTTNTPNLYTIREVGGIATNAYVDGRNPGYGKNQYYHSNQGIECYQISVGSLKHNLDILLNEKEQIVNAIASCF